VPRFGDVFDPDDVMDRGSRFTEHPAIALAVPEVEWAADSEANARAPLARHFGDWIFDEQDELGRGEAADSSVGRGAAGIAAALVFVGLHALGGVISVSAGMAWRRFVQKALDSLPNDERALFFVSRGGAAYLAAAEVAERFGEQGELEVEAVEEPSSIAGHETPELSYVGIEPWIVLLRRAENLRRYLVVAAPDGEILGALATPMRQWEPGYLRPAPEYVQTRRRRRWWHKIPGMR
jgi:hypothetical protein